MDEVDRLLDEVRKRAHGWLPLPVYRRIYESAAACGGGLLVEIGTSQGAATIAMALGAAGAGRDFRILTVDPFRPEVRPPGRTLDERMKLVRKGFEYFGVGPRIGMVVGTIGDLIAAEDPRDIRFLLIDADGRIDRDLALLHDRLAPECPIAIDDIDGRIYVRRGLRNAMIDQKHHISGLLAERLIAESVLRHRETICGQTGWYELARPTSAAEIERIALPAYRQLVRVTIGWREFGLLRVLLRFAARRAPWLARGYRRIRPISAS